MNKILLIIVTLLTLIAQSLAPAFAISEKETIITNNVSSQKIGGSTGTVVQPMGIKSWIVRHSIGVIASALRSFPVATLRSMLLNVTSASTTNTILNTRFVLANTLDSIASTIEVATTSIRQEIYNRLVGTVGHNIAWALSQLLDLTAL